MNPTSPPLPAIRPAGFADAHAIFRQIKAHPGELVPRPLGDIVANVDRFLVAATPSGDIVGTVSWAVWPEPEPDALPSVEIQSLSVATPCRGRGLGRALVTAAVDRIASLRPRQIVVLTFSPDFFSRLGFVPVPKDVLVYKLFNGCMHCTRYPSPFTCPEIAMALSLP
ncbi:MAG: GNAT family N-acetyltransferase [Kiritimatiellae bacterium]|nr:GNAT family N-acetyltransferase [Kiritimatiellia bacterium]